MRTRKSTYKNNRSQLGSQYIDKQCIPQNKPHLLLPSPRFPPLHSSQNFGCCSPCDFNDFAVNKFNFIFYLHNFFLFFLLDIICTIIVHEFEVSMKGLFPSIVVEYLLTTYTTYWYVCKSDQFFGIRINNPFPNASNYHTNENMYCINKLKYKNTRKKTK